MTTKINLYNLLFLSLFCIQHLSGQNYSVGGGIAYNATLDTPGLNLRGYHNIGESFCFGPEFGIFLPKETIEGDKKEQKFIWEVNLIAHYIFELHEKIGVYPIAGLNYTNEKETIEYLSTGESEKETIDAFGLNIGAGFHLPFKQVTPFAEYTYIASSLSEHTIIVGLFFTLGERTEEETNILE